MRGRAIHRRGFITGLGAGGLMLAASPAWHAMAAAERPSAIIGEIRRYRVKEGEIFHNLAPRFGLGYTELLAANPGVDPWQPGAGREIVIPGAHVLPNAPRRGLVLNLADQRLYEFGEPDGPVRSMPIGAGREGWDTPKGATEVVRKKKDPSWYVPESIREEKPQLPKVVPPGPNNPLGGYALYLGWPAYLIHGTNLPDGVGRFVSHGCIRAYPEDIAGLFERTPIGTPVRVMEEPVKLGWVDDTLYAEVHPNRAQAIQLEESGRFDPAPAPDMPGRIIAMTKDMDVEIDWNAADRLMRERRGIPEPVARLRTPPKIPIAVAEE